MVISEGQKRGAGAAMVLAGCLLHAWHDAGSIGLFLFAVMIAFFAIPATIVWLAVVAGRRLTGSHTR